MTDEELLESAAKAAGWDGLCDGAGNWNPLTDDGDALRLAVKLRIDIEHNHYGDQQQYVVASRSGCEMMFAPVRLVEEFDDNRSAATRRAIVRAAAEIGRNMG